MRQAKMAWRVGLWLIVLGGLLLGLAQEAQAQLFPNWPIKRERVPCELESPIYKFYRKQGYGYYPTLWRRYPDGLGGPALAAPDVEKAFRDLPIRDPLDLDEDGEPRRRIPGELPDQPPGVEPDRNRNLDPLEVPEIDPELDPFGNQPQGEQRREIQVEDDPFANRSIQLRGPSGRPTPELQPAQSTRILPVSQPQPTSRSLPRSSPGFRVLPASNEVRHADPSVIPSAHQLPAQTHRRTNLFTRWLKRFDR